VLVKLYSLGEYNDLIFTANSCKTTKIRLKSTFKILCITYHSRLCCKNMRTQYVAPVACTRVRSSAQHIMRRYYIMYVPIVGRWATQFLLIQLLRSYYIQIHIMRTSYMDTKAVSYTIVNIWRTNTKTVEIPTVVPADARE